MSENDFSWLKDLELTGPAKTFAKFCQPELERRGNSEEGFDKSIYEEAVRLVLRKLGALEMEDMK